MTATKEKRDSALGRTVTAAIEAAGPGGECPAGEHIAALVDGRLSGEERDMVMAHLASCRDCLQLASLTEEMVRPEERQGGRKWMALAGSVAAALVAVVALTMVNRPGEQKVALQKPASIPGATAPAASPPVVAVNGALPVAGGAKRSEEPLVAVAMAMAEKLPKDMSVAPVAANRALGFAEQSDAAQDSLALGRNLFILELALARRDRAATLRTLAEVERKAERLRLVKNVLVQLQDIRKGIARPSALIEARGRTVSLVSRAMKQEERSYLLLGEWTEGALVAARAEQQAFFASGYFRRNADTLVHAPLPRATAALVGELAELGRHAPPLEEEYRRIELLGEEIVGE